MYSAGSGSDPTHGAGLAHFLEHLAASASKHAPLGIGDKLLEDLGGGSDAQTSADNTTYWALVPPSGLETALWLLSDRMAFMLPAISEEAFETERRVVLNERRQSIDSSVNRRVSGVIFTRIFPAPHPYDHFVIGSEESIRRITMADMSHFYQRHYGPNNATLVIVGDTTAAQAETLEALLVRDLDA